MTEAIKLNWVVSLQQRMESLLKTHLPTTDSLLHQAMRYSTLNGGKRLRPLLVYATGQCFEGKQDNLDSVATAVELIHCYSLVHDDLPAMDDDDLRRGRPSCHKQFDAATAILAGDALQSLAFEILSQQTLPHQLDIICVLAKASGSDGMAGGQSLDMLGSQNKTLLADLQTIHALKTGTLFCAAIRMAALASGNCTIEELQYLQQFAEYFGLAFQIRDDILDIESTTNTLGKTTGKDASQNKATYPSLLGIEAAQTQLSLHIEEASNSLKKISRPTCYLETLLKQLALT